MINFLNAVDGSSLLNIIICGSEKFAQGKSGKALAMHMIHEAGKDNKWKHVKCKLSGLAFEREGSLRTCTTSKELSYSNICNLKIYWALWKLLCIVVGKSKSV